MFERCKNCGSTDMVILEDKRSLCLGCGKLGEGEEYISCLREWYIDRKKRREARDDEENEQYLERCWFADKHTYELHRLPLECIELCKRTLPLEMSFDLDKTDPRLWGLMVGFRFALTEFVMYTFGHNYDKEEREKLVLGLERRFKCAVDRGTPFEHFDETIAKILANVTYKKWLEPKNGR